MDRREVVKLLKVVEGLDKDELMVLQDVISLSLKENSGLHGRKEAFIDEEVLKKISKQRTNAKTKVAQPTRDTEQEERPRTFFDPSNFIIDP